jgi:hypothetical protein
VTENGWVIVTQRAWYATRKEGGKRVRCYAAGQTKDLVADRTALDEDLLVFDHVDQQWVLVSTEAMTDAACAEENCIEKILID